MSDFTLKELNFERIRQWIIEAKNKQGIDPVYSFIAAWIGFNHFYGTFASTNRKGFFEWAKINMNSSRGDKAQLVYLIQTKEFIEFFDAFRSEQEKLFSIKIILPVINLLYEKDVPNGVKGYIKLSDLNINQIFEVIYQIRNNLFHGDKDPFSNKRDKELSQIGSEFMLSLLNNLLSHTYGEVLDIFDNQQLEKSELLKKIGNTTLKD